MYTGSMSEIARPPNQDPSNASQFAFDSEKQPQRPLPQLRSVNLQEGSGQKLALKGELVRLMAEVRLEQMGYPRSEVKAFLEREVVQHPELENIKLTELSEAALDFVGFYIQERVSENGQPVAVLERRLRSRRSSANPVPQLMVHQEEMRGARVREQPVYREILCSICYLLTTHFCQQSCRHAFCEECLLGYVRQNISSGNFAIHCPQYNCSHPISSESVKKLLGKEQFERYRYFKEKNEKELNPENKFCSKPDCGEILIKSGGVLACGKCKSQYCEICLHGRHEGNCDAALKQALQQTYQVFHIKKCPNCKSPIEKSSGCNHMNCKKCKHEFCWLCLKPYSTYHYKYYNCFGCPGMQFQDEEEVLFQRAKQFLLYITLPLILALILSCYLASIPVYMLGTLLYKPLEWASNGRFFQRDISENLCGWMPDCLLSFTRWLLYQPRAILYSVFVAPIKITAIVCGGLCRAFQ